MMSCYSDVTPMSFCQLCLYLCGKSIHSSHVTVVLHPCLSGNSVCTSVVSLYIQVMLQWCYTHVFLATLRDTPVVSQYIHDWYSGVTPMSFWQLCLYLCGKSIHSSHVTVVLHPCLSGNPAGYSCGKSIHS